MLRILIDMYDMTNSGWCSLIDEVVSELKLVEGMPVILYYPNPGGELECDGTLHFVEGHWRAKVDRETSRPISGRSSD
jgi:hypothetical protein